MESRNLHEEEYEQQVQDEASPSCFSVATHHHAWRPPNFLLNNNNIHASCEEETTASNSLTANSMIQNMGFANWGNPNINLIDDQQTLISNNKMLTKQESSSTCSSSDHHLLLHHSPSTFPTEIMLSPSSTSPSELLLLNTLSPNYKHPMLANRELLELHPRGRGNEGGVTTNFSRIFPSVNISNLSTSNNNNNDNNNNNNNENSNISELVSSSRRIEMSHELDAFTTARLLNEGNLISQGIAPSDSHLLELFKLENHHHHHHHLQQQSSDLTLWNKANNPSSFDNNGVPESDKPSCIIEPKSTQNHQMASKKPRFESRSSCPPFKVRKEKLGDRIAALQQLVAPFGKTDTASVLMEAIGYIKFLQNQVETLSVPYMSKLSASRNKLRTSNTHKTSEEDCESGDEQKAELRSRGLCLVPISCMTYLAGDACNGGLWPPPSFHPGF